MSRLAIPKCGSGPMPKLKLDAASERHHVPSPLKLLQLLFPREESVRTIVRHLCLVFVRHPPTAAEVERMSLPSRSTCVQRTDRPRITLCLSNFVKSFDMPSAVQRKFTQRVLTSPSWRQECGTPDTVRNGRSQPLMRKRMRSALQATGIMHKLAQSRCARGSWHVPKPAAARLKTVTHHSRVF